MPRPLTKELGRVNNNTPCTIRAKTLRNLAAKKTFAQTIRQKMKSICRVALYFYNMYILMAPYVLYDLSLIVVLSTLNMIYERICKTCGNFLL